MPSSTPPLLLRPWRPEDAPALHAAIGESLAELRPWLNWAVREPVPLAELRERLVRYAVLDRGTEALLGGASLHPTGTGSLRVGYWVRTSQVRRGIARSAAAALIRRAFDSHGVGHVEIWCDPGNAASIAVARALGLVRAGQRDAARDDGTVRVVEVFRRDDADGLPETDVVIMEG
jgi:RimJ/RimL family protein N-acetyltransferase